MLQTIFSGEIEGDLQIVVLTPVVQLVLELNDLLQLLDLPVRFVTDERAVKVDGEHDKNDSKRHHDAGGSDGRGLTRTYAAVVMFALEGQELHPAQEHHLRQEEEGADDCGEGPGQLDVTVHALVGGLVDRVEVVNIADGLEVRKDAGADHEGEEVYGNQNGGAGAEGYQQPRGILVIPLQLYLHHGNLEHQRETFLLSRLIIGYQHMQTAEILLKTACISYQHNEHGGHIYSTA